MQALKAAAILCAPLGPAACRLYQLRQVHTPLQDGWGATTDGKSLIISDGSDRLYWLAPHGLAQQRSVQVTDAGRPIKWLNEVCSTLETALWLVIMCQSVHDAVPA